jgi:hypothetical protein
VSLAAALRDLDGKERAIVRLRESRAQEKLRHSARLRSHLN